MTKLAIPREYEIKLTLDPAAVDAFFEHPQIAEARAERTSSNLLATYFDTADGQLARRRCSLRVRRSEKGLVQTFKTSGGSLVDRGEWEQEGSSYPDATWLRTTPFWTLFDGERTAGALEARFIVDVSRTSFVVRSRDSDVEIAVDRGNVRCRGLSLAILEVELELKDGRIEDVVWLARKLVRDLPLTLSLVSKAERGQELFDKSWSTPRKAIAVDLSDATTLAATLTAVVQACLHTIARNAALIGTSADRHDAVHKTRIAVRHLRAILDLFEPMLRRKLYRSIQRDLRWISTKLGRARDADVFQSKSLDPAATSGSTPGMALLAERMRTLQTDAHDELTAALQHPRWRSLLIDLLALSQDGIRRREREIPAGAVLAARLAAAHGEIAAATQHWSRRTPDEFHDLRKAAKMLRYDLELLATHPDLDLRSKPALNLRDDLQTLQQTLGDIHDSDALKERLGDLFFRRKRPRHDAPATWRDLQDAAAALAGSLPQDNEALAAARTAARRLRKRTIA